jgi:glycosyltransferase involved in cell wall biosynthesis
MKKIKFTVVIPTRERRDTLEAALKSVTSQDYDSLEIIVSDNFSYDATEEVVKAANDKRVKYVNTGKRVSMSANWEFALTHVTGEWLTIIGDDDALLPGCLEKINQIADETEVEAIQTSTCSFAWPSLVGAKSGRLSVPMSCGWEIRDCSRWLAKVLRGEASYSKLPMLYNGGVVAFDALRKARGEGREYYHSCVPDVFSAVLLSQALPRYVYSYDPVAINGASIHSTGTSMYKVKSKTESGSLPATKFRSESNIPFHPDIPLQADGDYPKSVQVLVYESYLQVAEILPSSRKLEPAEQLKVILATAGPHEGSIHEWGKIFAELHGLDFNEIAPQARRYSRKLKISRLPENIASVLNTYSLSSDEYPLRDVYHASIAAALIRAVRPSRVKTILEAVHARIQRMRFEHV